MNISLIAVLGKNNEIGKGNELLCHLPADLKRFKAITTGHTVVMGRKTFESLPNGALPNRRNLVVSRNARLVIQDAEVCSSLDYALLKCINETEVFIIGGAQIYAQALPVADKLHITDLCRFSRSRRFFPRHRPKHLERNRQRNVSCR